MQRAEKQAYVDQLTTQLQTAKAAVITEYLGTTVAQMEQLRTKLHEQGITYKVIKNSLLKRALENAGIAVTDTAILDRPIALAVTDMDEVTAAKVLTGLHKEIETIVPEGGIINGEFVSGDTIRRLSRLPGREELYGKLVGSLAGLPTRMVRTVANPMQGLVTALTQVKAQKEA